MQVFHPIQQAVHSSTIRGCCLGNFSLKILMSSSDPVTINSLHIFSAMLAVDREKKKSIKEAE